MLTDTTTTILVNQAKVRLSGTVKAPDGRPLQRKVKVFGGNGNEVLATGHSDENGNIRFDLSGRTVNDLFVVHGVGLYNENHDLSVVCRGVAVWDD